MQVTDMPINIILLSVARCRGTQLFAFGNLEAMT